MLSKRQFAQKIENRRKSTLSVGIVFLMITSTWLGLISTLNQDYEVETKLVDADPLKLSEAQSTDQGGQGEWDGGMPAQYGLEMHDALWDMTWADSSAMYGQIDDISALALTADYGYMLEESSADDHDNDGIDDLNDLDDDNDGIYDLLERFDGCYGTDPYDHDNDGIQDYLDWDDDNDGILEGPIDYAALEAQGLDPRNVSMHRFVEPTTIHPLTGQPVGVAYRADQQPFDHDNDGVTDEDSDGSGAGRFDEDDDNDGRIDQFKWPCDFDNDGAQDYFDNDDDNDGTVDWNDADPYDASVTGAMDISGALFDDPVTWNFNQYRIYSAGVNFVDLEAAKVDANDDFDFAGGDDGDGAAGTPAFTIIYDGDLDGDGIPNFLDPDNDDDDIPDSSDTDDDNDGILDMYDPDDDNDGIPDICWNIDMNGDGLNDYTGLDSSPYQTPGADTDNTPGHDCEIDYDSDLDDDRFRAFDQNYNAIWDWLDPDMGGTPTPDDPLNLNTGNLDFPYDMDNDQIENENDTYPLSHNQQEAWIATCMSPANPNPQNPDPRCLTERASYSQFNDWDGDGVSNWDDIDDDGDGIIDIIDIDWDCDLDNDAVFHSINGSLYRDDGPNDVDSDIDGDGLSNDIDWDDDNDGLNDLYDPDDGNCGLVDYDGTDAFATPYYPLGDGADLDGSGDSQDYSDNTDNYWSLVWGANPFANVMLNYNGYDPTTNPPTGGEVPEFYWFMFTRWSSYNGANEWDIDADGDSLINGLDSDQDADGMPDWWDQDEGNDGLLDVNDLKMGGTMNLTQCGMTVGQLGSGFTCGYAYAIAYHMPLTGTNANFGSPYSTRPDWNFDQGNGGKVQGGTDWTCTSGAQGGCYHYDFGGDGDVESALSYTQIQDNRDAFLTWIGLTTGAWQWNFDDTANAGTVGFPDELGADLVKNSEDGDVDGDFTNNTVDLDEDYDAIYDWNDVDDDNDGIWDFFEVDTNDDLDDDANQDYGTAFFVGTNCDDRDDDGNDQDVDGDGWFQAVWDKGIMTQGLKSPRFYDVDNDNDGVPDSEDPDDDNNGVLDTDQELLPGCFSGEEQSPFDHDNDGIVDWADDDYDGDGISNLVEAAVSLTAPFDHDNDGTRDDIDVDDDEDGMHDEDEVLLWPLRFDQESTNPWDHDDFGGGVGIANPNDPSTGPDAIDNDDDNDSREDADFDHLEEGFTSDPCAGGSQSSDWDSDNNCVLDADDKAPTYITMEVPDTLWLDAQSPAIFKGQVQWINPVTQMQEVAPGLPVQVHIEWTGNNTTAIETVDVITNSFGNFTVGQFLFPEDLVVGDNETYRVYAEVTEMFAFNGNRSQSYFVGAEANMTVDYSAWTYFRSDEQPFWLDFKAHYDADWTRGLYDNRIVHSPISFEITGGLFGNRTNPSNFSGFNNDGYRTDSDGWASLTFVQNLGANGTWKQVQWNSTMDNGVGQIPGGYEEIVWNDLTKTHDVLIDTNTGMPLRYDYTNTSLPAGDIEITASVIPELADEWPFPYLHGDSSDPFSVRVMHRMNIEGELIVSGLSAVYYWDGTINNGDGTFGNWATLFHQPALNAAGVTFEEAKVLRPYPSLWDGNPDNLPGEAINLRNFLDVNSTHWFISLVNGGDSDLPPCGQVDPTDPQSPVRCEIVPEMNTGETFGVRGTVTNRTNDAWDQDPIALQVDIDGNGQFMGSQETAFTQRPIMKDGDATFEYNWTWYSQYAAGTYGVRVDFTNNAYYFTGNSTNLAKTGAYINVTVVGTTQFQMTSVPRLYRNTTTVIEARLLDNSLQPIRQAPVTWTWSYDGRSGVNYTDDLGTFAIPFEINPEDALGNYSLQFEYDGNRLRKGNVDSQSVWVVSRTYVSVISSDDNIRQSGDRWDFTAQVTDDNKTATIKDSGGRELSGASSPNGGLVDVIYEGLDFEGVMHRQVVATLAPNAGLISLPEPQVDGSHLCFYDGNGDQIPDRDTNGNGQLDDSESIGCLKANVAPLNPQLLRDDPDSFLPDGFGPVSVYLRFRETLPNEGCEILEVEYLSLQGKWDPCVDAIGNDHFRVQMAYNANGFSLIGRTSMEVDDQIVYTSEIDPLTGEVVPKPMVVTGQLTDELGTNLTYRNIRVNYEMVNSPAGPVACYNGITDFDGRFAITCPLSDVLAGKARVTVTYSAWDNNDAYRYQNKTVQTEFDVFSNSTLQIAEVGPFKSSVETFVAPNNGTAFPVLYLKESFHIDALLTQSNGQYVGGKCLNIYLDPQKNVRPLSSIFTRESDGKVEWFSGDPSQNPGLKGVETTGGELEGFRLLRVAFEPDVNVPGGCDKDTSNVLNGSHMDIVVLVRSRIDLQIKESWSHVNNNGLDTNDNVHGEVALLRDRLDLAIENEEIFFIREYWDSESLEWVVDGRNESYTNEQGVASFDWAFAGKTCAGEPCAGDWRIKAYYPGSTFFAESTDNITHEVHYMAPKVSDASEGIFTPTTIMALIIVLLGAAVAGVMYYQRVVARRQVEALRGILTDTMLQLQAANEYIAIIFDCYKQLVKHFRRHGFMKKVYETTREFESAVRGAFHMVPADQLDAFVAIFEEARYSDHEIGPSHRDRAIATLNEITKSLALALGDGGMITRTEDHESKLYGSLTKAGEFVAADGTVKQAGIDDNADNSNFKI